MAKWRSPIAFLKWLTTNDRLDAVAGSENTAVLGSRGQGFLRWVLSPDDLPYLEPPSSEPVPTGFFRFLFSFERLPSAEAVSLHVNASDKNGRADS